eukprot:m.44389 g.44389  ORF g.44389 m.44389 type:complete len:415 (+) comp8530_c0_seq2:146-1390(+)
MIFLRVLVASCSASSGCERFSAAAAFYSARKYSAAVDEYKAAFQQTSGDDPHRADIDHHVAYSRALKKIGHYHEALAQLTSAQDAANFVITEQGSAEHYSVVAALTFERGSVLCCAGRLDDAINAQIDSFDALSLLFDLTPTAEIEALLETRMLELVKLYRWSGFNEDADGMLHTAVPTRPHQWPARYNPALAADAKPWHSLTSPPGGPQIAKELDRLVSWLQSNDAALRREYHRANSMGHVRRQMECLHDPTVRGEWRQVGVWYNDSTAPCVGETPTTCMIARPEQSWRAALSVGVHEETHPLHLLRIGYSVVDARTHIRPHTGPTNEQLKLHYGLIIPHRGAQNCSWYLRVGGESRPWIQGQAFLFDDSFEHEVYSECTDPDGSAGERVVLQITLRHPLLDHHGYISHISDT